MKSKVAILTAVWTAGVFLGGCADDKVVGQTSANLSAPADLGAFEARWKARPTSEVQGRALAVVELLLGRSAGAAALASLGADGSEAWEASVGNEVLVRHFPKQDDLRVSNTVLADVVGGPDVGEAAARKAFDGAFDKLAGAGIINAAHFDRKRVSVAYTKFGSAPSGQEAVPQVTEYIFTLLRQVNGIDFANAGLRIAVHRGGQLSWIRVGGAEILSVAQAGKEVPTSKGFTFRQAVDPTTLDARFRREIPNGERKWGRAMYVLPDGVDSAVIEPKYVVTFSRSFISDGQVVKSRRETLAYSLRSTAAAPDDLTEKPDPSARGDVRGR